MGFDLTIWFSCAGRRVHLIECFRRDALELGLRARLLATDMNPDMSSACRVADYAQIVPPCTSDAFIPALLELCAKQHVGLLVPTIDTELLPLAQHADQFTAIGTRVIVSWPGVIEIARNKLHTCRHLDAVHVPVPRTAPLREVFERPSEWPWPLIVKPLDGSASIGIHRVGNVGQLAALCLELDRYVAQELWIGREFTVNVFLDQSGVLRCAVPHWRYETRSGEVSKGVTVRHSVLESIAGRIADSLKGGRGPLCFQAIVNERGMAGVFDINARFGGGFPLAHQAGAEFSRWLIEETLGLPSTAHDRWREGAVMLRYDAAVFFERNTLA
jgi:carbamoyl-phosphate synthase large subunit